MKYIALIFLTYSISVIFCEKSLKDWYEFKNKFGKNYSNESHEIIRYEIWKSNRKYIEDHNEKAAQGFFNFTLGMNPFGDLTDKEFVERFTGVYNGMSKPLEVFTEFRDDLKLPSIDWRTFGWVTPVENQGQCGSCWTYSSSEAIEGQYFNRTGKLVKFSRQELLDCVTESYGCRGGYIDKAFEYVMKNGIMSGNDYPYVGAQGSCKLNRNKIITKISKFYSVSSGNENELQKACSQIGPISIAIDASLASFKFYKTGIYYDAFCSSTKLDHAVLLVGYGSENYIVKNSWGTTWGENGYVRMSKDRNNNCGIATQASFPLILK